MGLQLIFVCSFSLCALMILLLGFTFITIHCQVIKKEEELGPLQSQYLLWQSHEISSTYQKFALHDRSNHGHNINENLNIVS